MTKPVLLTAVLNYEHKKQNIFKRFVCEKIGRKILKNRAHFFISDFINRLEKWA